MTRLASTHWRTRRTALLYVAPALAVLVAIFLYPIADAFWTSLLRWNLISGVKRWTGFDNYAAVLADRSFPEVIRVTFLYSGLSVCFELALGLALALLIRAGLRARLPG